MKVGGKMGWWIREIRVVAWSQHYRPLTKWIWGKTEARGGEEGGEDGGGRVGGVGGAPGGAGAAAQFRPGEGPPGSWPVDVTGLSALPWGSDGVQTPRFLRRHMFGPRPVETSGRESQPILSTDCSVTFVRWHHHYEILTWDRRLSCRPALGICTNAADATCRARTGQLKESA